MSTNNNQSQVKKTTRSHIYAESYGMVYRFSPRRWKQMLQRVAAGGAVNYDDYGRLVLTIDKGITDLDAERAAMELEGLLAAEEMHKEVGK